MAISQRNDYLFSQLKTALDEGSLGGVDFYANTTAIVQKIKLNPVVYAEFQNAANRYQSDQEHFTSLDRGSWHLCDAAINWESRDCITKGLYDSNIRTGLREDVLLAADHFLTQFENAIPVETGATNVIPQSSSVDFSSIRRVIQLAIKARDEMTFAFGRDCESIVMRDQILDFYSGKLRYLPFGEVSHNFRRLYSLPEFMREFEIAKNEANVAGTFGYFMPKLERLLNAHRSHLDAVNRDFQNLYCPEDLAPDSNEDLDTGKILCELNAAIMDLIDSTPTLNRVQDVNTDKMNLSPAQTMDAKSSNEKQRTTAQSAAERLERLRKQGEPFKSQPQYAESFKCSASTINNAIHSMESLRRWAKVGEFSEKKDIVKAISLNEYVEDNTEQVTESDPSDITEPKDIDSALEFLLKQARPDERDKIMAMPDANRSELAKTYLTDPDKWERILNRQV